MLELLGRPGHGGPLEMLIIGKAVLASLLIVGLVSLIVWLVRRARDSKAQPMADGLAAAPSEAIARDVLDQRLARGEIEIEDYKARLAALEVSQPA